MAAGGGGGGGAGKSLELLLLVRTSERANERQVCHTKAWLVMHLSLCAPLPQECLETIALMVARLPLQQQAQHVRTFTGNVIRSNQGL